MACMQNLRAVRGMAKIRRLAGIFLGGQDVVWWARTAQALCQVALAVDCGKPKAPQGSALFNGTPVAGHTRRARTRACGVAGHHTSACPRHAPVSLHGSCWNTMAASSVDRCTYSRDNRKFPSQIARWLFRLPHSLADGTSPITPIFHPAPDQRTRRVGA